MRVVHGEIFDVAVNLRRDSKTYGAWVGEFLSAENRKQLWIPPGFAHGFLTLSESAEFLYKCTDYYSPDHERCIRWNDQKIGIDWPFDPQQCPSFRRGMLPEFRLVLPCTEYGVKHPALR